MDHATTTTTSSQSGDDGGQISLVDRCRSLKSIWGCDVRKIAAITGRSHGEVRAALSAMRTPPPPRATVQDLRRLKARLDRAGITIDAHGKLRLPAREGA